MTIIWMYTNTRYPDGNADLVNDNLHTIAKCVARSAKSAAALNEELGSRGATNDAWQPRAWTLERVQ